VCLSFRERDDNSLYNLRPAHPCAGIFLCVRSVQQRELGLPDESDDLVRVLRIRRIAGHLCCSRESLGVGALEAPLVARVVEQERGVILT
jgi:hypothetical protein